MADTQHSALTGAELHEPKGVDSAAVDKVYVSDGAGSGSWSTVTVLGWEDINHSGTVQNLAAATRTKVLNDNAGAQSNSTYQLPNATSSIWDTTNNQFDFAGAGLEVGDTVDIRIDVTYTVNTSNDNMSLELDMAVGGTSPFTLPVDERNIDTAGSQDVVRFFSVYIGSADVLNNPAELYITSNTAGDSITVKGWYVKMEPVNPRYS